MADDKEDFLEKLGPIYVKALAETKKAQKEGDSKAEAAWLTNALLVEIAANLLDLNDKLGQLIPDQKH